MSKRNLWKYGTKHLNHYLFYRFFNFKRNVKSSYNKSAFNKAKFLGIFVCVRPNSQHGLPADDTETRSGCRWTGWLLDNHKEWFSAGEEPPSSDGSTHTPTTAPPHQPSPGMDSVATGAHASRRHSAEWITNPQSHFYVHSASNTTVAGSC